MPFPIKRLRYLVLVSLAALLSACVIASNDHHKHSHHGNYSANNNKSISERAQNACFKRMGPGSQIQQISDLKPGWFEVILLNPRSGHKAACTVNQQGHIDDWVNMKSRY
jgi:hypothetical protein